MQRVTITVDDELMLELDRIIAARGYQNRSEAIRDLARAGIRQAAEALADLLLGCRALDPQNFVIVHLHSELILGFSD